MKKISLSLILVLCSTAFLKAQSDRPVAYYVVIGAFAKIDNAIHFTDKANKNSFNAAYSLHPTRKLYYVYLLSTPDKKKAYSFLIKMRAETSYKECWVYEGDLGDVSEKPVEKPIEKPIEKPVEKPIEPVVEPKKDSVIVVIEQPKVDSVKIIKPEPVKPPVKKPEGKPFLFKLVNIETGNEVMGEVHIQESTRSPQYQAFRANEVAYLKAPVNREGTFVVTTNAPGFQQLKTTISYATPGVTTGPDGEFIFPMQLKHAKSGDYIDFNNVHFIRNSSVMTPDSQNELDGLASLMKENTKYKIKIHGHCNGRTTRELILRGTSTKFFAMDPSANKKTTASDKILTEDRANAVKAYLESQGIEGDRIATKGEGGKIPLYPEGSTLSSYNDRVEVEIKSH